MAARRLSTPMPTRREFVAGVLTSAAALAAAGCSPAPRARPAHAGRADARKLGVALVGLGNYSETQLGPALKQTRHCELRGIVTGTPSKIEKWRDEYGLPVHAVYDYDTLPRIADNAEIDVVYVVTPTALHAKYAIMAAQAGKHVWCEKPMAMDVAECQAIIDACRTNQVSLSIGYRMHHEPNTQTVMQFAREKPYGAIRTLRAIAGDHNAGEPSWRMDPKMGGGALYDMGVYSVNALRYSTGEEPLRVTSARQWADRPELFRAVDENTEFELEFPSGAVGYGKASRFSSENFLRVEAERGWYQLEPMQAYSGVEGETSDGRELDREVEDQQAQQMDDDALAILEGRAPLCPGEEGLRDVRIINAIIQAATTGAPVPIET
jgi:glucose-fructose oxidoreductase